MVKKTNTGWMPYPAEARFLDRNKISRKNLQAWCGRRDAR